jgi:hypothetical protein
VGSHEKWLCISYTPRVLAGEKPPDQRYHQIAREGFGSDVCQLFRYYKRLKGEWRPRAMALLIGAKPGLQQS